MKFAIFEERSDENMYKRSLFSKKLSGNIKCSYKYFILAYKNAFYLLVIHWHTFKITPYRAEPNHFIQWNLSQNTSSHAHSHGKG